MHDRHILAPQGTILQDQQLWGAEVRTATPIAFDLADTEHQTATQRKPTIRSGRPTRASREVHCGNPFTVAWKLFLRQSCMLSKKPPPWVLCTTRPPTLLLWRRMIKRMHHMPIIVHSYYLYIIQFPITSFAALQFKPPKRNWKFYGSNQESAISCTIYC